MSRLDLVLAYCRALELDDHIGSFTLYYLFYGLDLVLVYCQALELDDHDKIFCMTLRSIHHKIFVAMPRYSLRFFLLVIRYDA